MRDGQVRVDSLHHIGRTPVSAGYPVQAPTVEIVEIGAGGGSVAWADDAGGLHVGPRSAGAEPGPACYGRGGTEPTLTDANLAAGRIDPGYFLGGTHDARHRRRASARWPGWAAGWARDAAAVARGVIRYAVAQMSHALRLVTLRRGYDPRDFAFVAYGGAGPLHAALLARELGITRTIIPPGPGHFSAFGMLAGPLRADAVRTVVGPLDGTDLTAAFAQAQQAALDELGAGPAATAGPDATAGRRSARADGIAGGSGGSPRVNTVTRYAELRYQGQEHTLEVPVPEDGSPAERGEWLSQLRNAFDRQVPGGVRVPAGGSARGGVGPGQRQRAGARVHLAERRRGGRRSPPDHRGGSTSTPTAGFWRFRSSAGPGWARARHDGPCVIEEPAATTLVLPGQAVQPRRDGQPRDRGAAGDRQRRPVDRFTLDVLREGFAAITDEMFVSLQRTSQSPIIYEVLDFGVGIADARGELVSQGNGIAGFLGPLGDAITETIARVPDLRPGDVIAANDPYSGGGTHLSDVALVRPVFAPEGSTGDRLIGFAAAKGHWTEVGGKDPGSWTADSTDVYAEGLQLPFVRAFREGQPVADLAAILAANSRLPDMVLGDLYAQAACLEVAERRLLEMCARFGTDVVTTAMQVTLDRSERLARLALGRIPHGVFEAEDRTDEDGLGNGPFPRQGPGGDLGRRRGVRLHRQPPAGARADQLHLERAGLRGPHRVQGHHRPGRAGDRRLVPAADHRLPAGDDLQRDRARRRSPRTSRPPRWPPTWSGGRWRPRSPPADRGQLRVGLLHLARADPSGHRAAHAARRAAAGGWGRQRTQDGQHGLVSVGDGETYVIPVEIAEQRYGDPGRAVRVRRGARRRRRAGGAAAAAWSGEYRMLQRRGPADRGLGPAPVPAVGRGGRPRRLAQLRARWCVTVGRRAADRQGLPAAAAPRGPGPAGDRHRRRLRRPVASASPRLVRADLRDGLISRGRRGRGLRRRAW